MSREGLRTADEVKAEAQFNLGFMHHHGVAMPQDLTRAAELYTAAAAQGFASAQCNLGQMYFDGDGVPQDRTRAMELLKAAASQGDADAKDFLTEIERVAARTLGMALDRSALATSCGMRR